MSGAARSALRGGGIDAKSWYNTIYNARIKAVMKRVLALLPDPMPGPAGIRDAAASRRSMRR